MRHNSYKIFPTYYRKHYPMSAKRIYKLTTKTIKGGHTVPEKNSELWSNTTK